MKENKSKVITIILMVIVALLFAFNLAFSIRSCSSAKAEAFSSSEYSKFSTPIFPLKNGGGYAGITWLDFDFSNLTDGSPRYVISNWYNSSNIINTTNYFQVGLYKLRTDSSKYAYIAPLSVGGSCGWVIYEDMALVADFYSGSLNPYFLFNRALGSPVSITYSPYIPLVYNLSDYYTRADGTPVSGSISNYQEILFTWQFSDTSDEFIVRLVFTQFSYLSFQGYRDVSLIQYYSDPINYNDYNRGYNEGYDFGFAEGESVGFAEGADIPAQALDSAYDSGLQAGYQSGISEQFDDIDPFHVIVTFVNDLLSIQVFRGVTVSTIFSIQFGFILLGLALKFFLGG